MYEGGLKQERTRHYFPFQRGYDRSKSENVASLEAAGLPEIPSLHCRQMASISTPPYPHSCMLVKDCEHLATSLSWRSELSSLLIAKKISEEPVSEARLLVGRRPRKAEGHG
jgi:hypothetical protein